MLLTGLLFVTLSGMANGLFSAPMKIIPGWKWENIWLVFIVTACLLMPVAITAAAVADPLHVISALPGPAVRIALLFGFLWGFGAILFGLSVDRLGVSVANSLVIGLSSAAGSFLPLVLSGRLRAEPKQIILMIGVAVFVVGVALCAAAGRLREAKSVVRPSLQGYVFALGSGIMSAIFNVGYALAAPIAAEGQRLGLSEFDATNLIWLLMLGAGSVPNILFCLWLMAKNRTAKLFTGPGMTTAAGLSILMGLLWGASIFLYGAATPKLGDMGPSVGWPLSLAVGLLVANLMGTLLGEWKLAEHRAVVYMRIGILTLLVAIGFCAASARM